MAMTPQFLAADDPRTKDRVALASYPRSGNSLLRSLLEKLYDISTGSDADTKRHLNQQLIDAGMVGEGVSDERVWIVKTHYPERLGRVKFNAKRAIVLVRNPFDAIVSYFNMVITQSHTHSLLEDEYVKYADIWESFVYDETQIWKAFYDQWAMVQTPTLLVRYEDLVLRREKTMTMVAEFLSGVPLDEDLADRIKELAKLDSDDAGAYGPRVAVGHFGASTSGHEDDDELDLCSGFRPLEPGRAFLRSLHRFTDAQKKHVLSSTRDALFRFGYWNTIPNNPFAVREPQLDRSMCLLRHYKTKAKELYLKINANIPLRPQTADDPWRRGFGRRWKRELAMLPPPRTRQRKPLAPATSPARTATEELTPQAFNDLCSSWIHLGTPPACTEPVDEAMCAYFSEWSWQPIKPPTILHANGYLKLSVVRDGAEFCFHVVYHTTFKVPALFFDASRIDGTPCGMDEVFEWMNPRAKDLQNASSVFNTFIARDYHPHLHSMWYLVHPCQTSLVMDELTCAASSRVYLLAWWSIIGPLFNLGLDPSVHMRAAARLKISK